MASSDDDFAELFNQVRSINSRVLSIERTQEMLVRAQAQKIVEPFLEKLTTDPVIGWVYLAVDGTKSQNDISEDLRKQGHAASAPTISRKLDELEKDWHLIVLKDRTKSGKLYDKGAGERILGLSRQVARALR